MRRGDVAVRADREGGADGTIAIGSLDVRQQLERQRLLVADRVLRRLLHHDLEGRGPDAPLQLGRNVRECQVNTGHDNQ